MWIFTANHVSYNMDSYDRLFVDRDGTFLVKTGYPSAFVSQNNVEDVIRDAIRRGDKYVEVE